MSYQYALGNSYYQEYLNLIAQQKIDEFCQKHKVNQVQKNSLTPLEVQKNTIQSLKNFSTPMMSTSEIIQKNIKLNKTPEVKVNIMDIEELPSEIVKGKEI